MRERKREKGEGVGEEECQFPRPIIPKREDEGEGKNENERKVQWPVLGFAVTILNTALVWIYLDNSSLISVLFCFSDDSYQCCFDFSPEKYKTVGKLSLDITRQIATGASDHGRL